MDGLYILKITGVNKFAAERQRSCWVNEPVQQLHNDYVKDVNTCLACNKPIKSGRHDKKFCGDGCRDDYSNKRMQAERAEIKRSDLILKHNRRNR